MFNFGKVKKIEKDSKSPDVQTAYAKSSISEEDWPAGTWDIHSHYLMSNNYPKICATACSVCWDKPIPEDKDFNGILKYIGARVSTGHGSILEHSNIVTFYQIPDIHLHALVELLGTPTQYLHTAARHSKRLPVTYLLIGGSIRGYRDLIENCPRIFDNAVAKAILEQMYTYGYSEFFIDFINRGILNADDFTNVPIEMINEEIKGSNRYKVFHQKFEVDNDLFIENIDDISYLMNNLGKVCRESDLFTLNELLEMCTVTVLFKNMSRTGTHQLVRHRNAITQESQRYVDYSEACFANPAKFKPETYRMGEKYKVKLGFNFFEFTLAELGAAIQGFYGQLTKPLNKESTPLIKEDARAFLPGNTECKKLYMTFTYKSLFKFFDLRADPHAQAEIRSYAIRLFENWNEISKDHSDDKFTGLHYELNSLSSFSPRSIELVNQKSLEEAANTSNQDDCIEVMSETILPNYEEEKK